MYNVQIQHRQERKIVALLLKTSFANNRQAGEIPPFFHKVMEEGFLENVDNRINQNQICVIGKKENSPELDYFMGVEVNSFEKVPEGMEQLTLPGNTYAVSSFVKTGNFDVMKVLGYIMEKWLPENEYNQNLKAPVCVYYDRRFMPIYKEKGYSGNPVAEIQVPVVRK